jgi:predicted DNA-binding transcriptional regulator AlpA
MPARRILRRREAAAYCGLAPGTLANLAARGEGPPVVSLGTRAIGYEVRALDAWLELHFTRPPHAGRHVQPMGD